MDTENFSKWGKHMIDFICEYFDTLGERNVLPSVEPGYLRPLLPETAPESPEEWPKIFEDLKRLILPGLTHWQHPRFHAYFPAATCSASIMGDMLSTALGCNGFSWAASPAITELEVVTMDWMARLLKLPGEFTHKSGKGGGVIQSSASDCVLVAMLAARHQAIEYHKHKFQGERDVPATVLSRLVAYTSTLAHSCVEKAGMICFVNFRSIEPDENYSIQGSALEKAIEEDIKRGLIPFFVCATLGSTSCCSFDDLPSIGEVCKKYSLWLHVDAAYAGSSFICPEFRPLLNGIEYASSLNVNPNKWMLVGFDCSLLWVKDRESLTKTMIVNPVYLQHKHSSKAVDFRHWGIPLSRRFRSLKLWFVLRSYGAQGLREYIRNHVQLASVFAEKVRSDDRFEIFGKPTTGLVCFRLKGSNTVNQYLTRAINESLKLHVVPAVVNDIYFIRFAICRTGATESDINYAWAVIQALATEILLAKSSLDRWRSYMAKDKGYQPYLAEVSMEELDTSDESDDEVEKERDTVLISEMEEKLTQIAVHRLKKLEESGQKEAYYLLLDYLKTLGWDTNKLIRRGEGIKTDSEDGGSSSLQGKAELLEITESDKDHSEERKSSQELSSNNNNSGSLEREKAEKEPNGNFETYFNACIPTSSPIVSDSEKRDSIGRLSGILLSSQNSSDTNGSMDFKNKQSDMNPLKLHQLILSQNNINEGQRVRKTGANWSSVGSSHPEECRISYRDLAVGVVHTKTLTKLRRHSLIRMLADPSSVPDQQKGNERDLERRAYWKNKYREFNGMLISASVHNALNELGTPTTDSTNPNVKEEVIRKWDVSEAFSEVHTLPSDECDSGLTDTLVEKC